MAPCVQVCLKQWFRRKDGGFVTRSRSAPIEEAVGERRISRGPFEPPATHGSEAKVRGMIIADKKAASGFRNHCG